ncbi:PD-(D/E)XK nuclease family protein [Rickettsiales endosymbiont of Stachyamoeba lipophora]|uniref:PD-(D/E)XK nuclease family protein n=1 Tax=Rickettsiales endosymbiont of Stachyamoeba lipophora TaxID=2486578 RepID=UPI0013DE2296|nr:PD-(D/E)XK nuclease family protein [Rickettsiales endosymbiont of Stachyamoeba lipophora]
MNNIYFIPQNEDFASALLKGLEQNYKLEGSWQEVVILLPTRRSVKLLYEACLKFPFAVKELPKICSIFDIDEAIEPGLIEWLVANKSRLLSKLEQDLILADIIKDKLQIKLDTALKIAKELNQIINSNTKIKLQAALDRWHSDLFSQYFIKTQYLLEIATEDFTKYLAEYNLYDFNNYVRAKLTKFTEIILKKPSCKIICAGFAGENFIANEAIGNLFKQHLNCSVIVPYYSPNNHNISSIGNIFRACNFEQSLIQNWYKLNDEQDVRDKAKHLQVVEFDSLHKQAAMIAYTIKKQHDNNRSALVICNNVQLINKIKSYASIWGANIDCSINESINSDLAIKTFLKIGELLTSPNLICLLEILKSPGVIKLSPEQIWEFEIFLRKEKITYISELSEAILEKYNLREIVNFTKQSSQNIAKFFTLNILVYHYIIGEDISTHEEYAEVFNELAKVLTRFNIHNSTLNYHRLISQLFSEFYINNPYTNFEGIKILSANEAILQHADLVILADFNEESWGLTYPDWLPPFLQDRMEVITYQDALKKQNYIIDGLIANNPQIMITRATGDQGVIYNIYRQFYKIAESYPIANLELKQDYCDLFENISLIKIEKPNPVPSILLRPQKIWATDVQKLLKNPYEYYARKILNLRPLDSLVMEFEGRDFGILLHELLDQITVHKEQIGTLEMLSKFVDSYLHKYLPKNILLLWQERFYNLNKILWKLLIDNNYHITSEVTGNIVINNIQLYARIDNLSITANEAIITDYKTGVLPTKVGIINGYECQLTIAALIAQCGAFNANGLDLSKIPLHIKYLKLIGGDKLIEEVILQSDEIERLIELAEVGLNRIFEQFLLGEAPFIAIPKVHYNITNDYDYLSRTAEWAN